MVCYVIKKCYTWQDGESIESIKLTWEVGEDSVKNKSDRNRRRDKGRFACVASTARDNKAEEEESGKMSRE